MKQQDLTGRKFGRLTVLGPDKESTATGRNKRYICRCDCGNTCTASQRALLEGSKQSCGCLRKERTTAATRKDIAPGTRFGRLTVVERTDEKSNSGSYLYKCRCDCGNEKIVDGTNLRKGATKSCGCLRKERQRKAVQTHGGYKSRIYRVWDGMIQRCTNPNNPAYHHYGGRGITVCDEWRNSFEAFREWAYSSGYDDKAPKWQCTLDRKDVNGNYGPENCRWVTQKEQMNNTRRCHYITVDGVTKDISQWADEIGKTYSAIQWIIRTGKDPVEYIKKKLHERGVDNAKN